MVHRARPVEIVVNSVATCWPGRRVLITGHTGFKGAWLWQWLDLLGADLFGYALPPDTEPNLFRLAGIGEAAHAQFGDIRQPQKIQALLSDVKPEIVFHLAAQSLVRNSYRDPIGTFETNVLGTAYLLDAIRVTSSVRCAVIITSDKCYRPGDSPIPHREDDPLGGYDPYSASKASAEIAVESWRRSFFSSAASPGIASVRAGNVIGGGDWNPDRLIPDCVRAFQEGYAVTLRNPSARRPWQHILDALAGYITLAERLYCEPQRFSEAWNFGPAPEETASVLDVVQSFTTHWDGRWIQADSAGPAEAPVLSIDSSKARDRLSWRPWLNLQQAIAWTAEWYQRFAAGASASELCLEQIQRFEARGGSMPA